MTRIVAFSDSHFRRYMRVEAANIEWLPLQLKCLDQIFNYCLNVEPDLIIFNGDLFDSKNNIDVVLFNEVWNKFRSFEMKDRLIINTGNHDMATVDGKSILSAFKPLCRYVVDFNTTYSQRFDDWELRVIPYHSLSGSNLEKGQSKKGILFLHEEIEGAVLGSSNFKLESSVKLFGIRQWDYVIDGHIHKPQSYKNVKVVGSIMQQNFGETGEKKRFLDIQLDGDDIEIESVAIDGPEFFTDIKLDQKKKISYILNKSKPHQFFRIDVEEKDLTNDIFKLPNVFPKIVDRKHRETRVKEDLPDDKLIEMYVDQENNDKELYDKLVDIGKQIIKESF